MPRTLTIRTQVLDYVAEEGPCKASEVITNFDGRLSADQVYAALSHLCKGETPLLERTGRGYYAALDANDRIRRATEDPPAPSEDGEIPQLTVTGRPMEDFLAEIEAFDAATPVDLVIQNPEQKIVVLRLCERVLAPELAATVSLIRADLERIANL